MNLQPHKSKIANVDSVYEGDNSADNSAVKYSPFNAVNISADNNYSHMETICMRSQSLCCEKVNLTDIDGDIPKGTTHDPRGKESIIGLSPSSVKVNYVTKFTLDPRAKCFNPSILTTNAMELSTPVIMDLISGDSFHHDVNVTESLPCPSNTNQAKTNDISDTPYSSLNSLRIKNPNRIILGHLNINSIRNKIDMVSDLVEGKIDILLLSETKIDNTFPTSQFKISGFSLPHRHDRSVNGLNGGGLLLYVRKDIPSKIIPMKFLQESDDEIECIIIEFTIYKKKWLVFGAYNPNKAFISNHLSVISKNLDFYASSYDNIILLGDFNSEILEEAMDDFCGTYNLKSLIKDPTCFKNLENPSCIDLILTNRFNSFQDSCVVETGLSDFHSLTITVLKTCFKKQPPKIISYRDYKHFSHFNFRAELEDYISGHDVLNVSNDEFVSIFMNIFDKHAPLKLKYVRANDSPFMTKDLRKAIMVRSKLKNRLNKEKSLSAKLAYKTQRNLCTSLLKKVKRDFYGKLNPSDISDNKKFWKIVKPFFSEKVISTESISIVENNVLHTDDKNVSDIFNSFFSNAVENLGIVENDMLNNVVNGPDPILNAIKKYENHESIININA